MIPDNMYNICESKHIQNNGKWRLIRLILDASKDEIVLRHCDINELDISDNTSAYVYYNSR